MDISPQQLIDWVLDARARSIEMIADLDEEQVAVPLLSTVNPMLWECCHAAYFQELWVLRRGAGQGASLADADALFDSVTIEHADRWRLPVPGRDEALRYVEEVRDRVVELLARDADGQCRYYAAYSVFHEDMHAEASTYTRQALGFAAPNLGIATETIEQREGEPAPGGTDIVFEGGPHELGMARGPNRFCFDNEKWGHTVEIAPFAMARDAVTEGEFAEFVEDDGYDRDDLWSTAGWAARQAAAAELPRYWRRSNDGILLRRVFNAWRPISASRAAAHISYYEAEAYCRWAKRRLPTEAEWELAAQDANTDGANLDWAAMQPVDARALDCTDTAKGCRQMLGNVWEWTSSTFEPYPGFEPDMYSEYSQSSFSTRKVLRGGGFATRSRLIRPTWRNFYQPARRDVFSGFRTCAL